MAAWVDFFHAQLTTELRLKPQRKVLRVTWSEEGGVVPE
jgi:hypothetical protein